MGRFFIGWIVVRLDGNVGRTGKDYNSALLLARFRVNVLPNKMERGLEYEN